MYDNKWTEKPGALLVAITIVFGLATNNAWSQISPAITRIIPQIAVGSFDGGLTKYSTVIEIVNPNPVSVTLSGDFFRPDGMASNLTFTTNLTTVPAFSNGILPQVTLDPNKVLVISAGTTPSTTPPTGTDAWARITTSSSVSSSTFLDFRDARTNALLSRLGVPASPTNMAKFVIPRVRNVAAGLDVGFALVNTAVTSATLTATLLDAAGATIASRNLTIPGSTQLAQFTEQFFNLTNEPSGTNYQFIIFDSGNAAQFAAMAVAFERADQTNVPIDVIR